MGGGSYSSDVPRATHVSTIGTKHSDDAVREMTKTVVDPSILMNNGRIIHCKQRDSVGIVIDGTGSMGDWSKTLRDKSMMFTGQIRCQNYLDDPAFNLSVVGDANPTRGGGFPDEAPIQMTEFVTNNENFKALTKKIYLEGGGGGQAKESYELALYGYARKIAFQAKDRRKGYLFILGDEGFYEVIKAGQLKEHFGEKNPENIQTADIFIELKEKYHLFHFHINTGNYGEEGDRKIQKQWRDVLGEHFLTLPDPNAFVDIMLGSIALIGGTRDIDAYVDQDMVERKQDEVRRKIVKAKLKEINWQI